MINGLEGIPGSGKTYEMVVYHVLAAVKSGRKVITNLPLALEMWAAIDPRYLELIELRERAAPVRGTWDATRPDAFRLFEDGRQEQPADDVPLFGHVWDFYDTWRHEKTGLGPLFIVDECHVPMPKIGARSDLIQWFKLHRHFNADVLLATQQFRDVCQPIAGLIGILVKVRKADILGKADHYIRKTHGGYRGALISSEQRKYLQQYFPLYRSHTQGQAVTEASATDVAPFIVKFNRFKWAFIACAAGYCVWAFWPSSKTPKPTVKGDSARTVVQTRTYPVAATPAVVVLPAEVKEKAIADPDEVPEPLESKTVHLTGSLTLGQKTLYTFVIAGGGKRIAQVTSDELATMGYRWQPLTSCAGTLRWKAKARPIICDAPEVPSGGDQRPVVLAVDQAGQVAASSRQH